MAREFTSAPAVRKAQHLFIGLVGASSSGKTWSALELAKGIQSVVGGDIAMVDTENNRGLAYADNFRNRDGTPGFIHIPFEPPWGSLDYVDALKYAATKAKTIILDSGSHEHEGEGGMIDFQEREVDRLSHGDPGKAERVKMLAWAKPKAARRVLLKTITRLDANLIMCFRAKNTSKPGKDANGKSIVIPMGFVPIAGEEFVFEMALSALFLPGAQGRPTWNPEFPGEKLAVKVPRQFEWLRERDGPLNFEVGRQLAQWARGETVAAPAQPMPTATSEPSLVQRAETAADRGGASLDAFVKALPKPEKDALKPYGADLRARANAADGNNAPETRQEPVQRDEAHPAPNVGETSDTAAVAHAAQTYRLYRTSSDFAEYPTAGDVLAAYEIEVGNMYRAGTSRTKDLLDFYNLNRKQLGEAGLAQQVKDIEARVCVPDQSKMSF